ncbi:MAG: hypothetical protein M3Y42_10730 [Actinomycetota bacterium]|nr:hypothetical protein [Actinomycetota bacterium]MDQ2957428.1 hypothetical protein [Actinomycetota bacterium]
MELSAFTEQVQQQLLSAAALGDERTREVAAALATTSQSAVRMAILDALAAASAEVTEALYQAGDPRTSAAVTMHLDGERVRFKVSVPPTEDAEPARERPDDGEASARISLRLPESVKAEIEQAAGQAEISVNSWLVRAATTALRGGSSGGDSWHTSHGRRITGWVTG